MEQEPNKSAKKKKETVAKPAPIIIITSTVPGAEASRPCSTISY